MVGANHLTYFTDRPNRDSGTTTLTEFAKNWETSGFSADPPNVALTVHGAPTEVDTLIATMTDPVENKATQTLTATLIKLSNEKIDELSGSTGHLASHAIKTDAALPQTFGPSTLFIDPAAGCPANDCQGGSGEYG